MPRRLLSFIHTSCFFPLVPLFLFFCFSFFCSSLPSFLFFFFFLNYTSTTEIYTLSLHDALPISKLNWYSIDPVFYGNRRPSGITDADLSSYATRRVFLDELFPNMDVMQGQSQVLYTLDLVYYPNVRGPYNYNPQAAGSDELPDPARNFGGIFRGLDATNFEQSNVEYIEFWLMDPFIY